MDKKMITPKLIKRLHAIYSNIGMNEEGRRNLLLEFTDGRTNTTKGLTYREAIYLCGFLYGKGTKFTASGETKRRRSGVLKRMQQIGIDTTDWDAVDIFCQDPRIAGKRFCQLTDEELLNMIPKLEQIKKK